MSSCCWSPAVRDDGWHLIGNGMWNLLRTTRISTIDLRARSQVDGAGDRRVLRTSADGQVAEV